jgi:hypothetical protein
MSTIFRSKLGFLLVEIFPKGVHFDARYFCCNILTTDNERSWSQLQQTVHERIADMNQQL